MKSEQAHVLRFDDGSQVSYGVPDFATEEEAEDFLAHVRTEIEEGAAEYFYAFYLSVPNKLSPEAIEAIEYVRNQTHLITPQERRPPGTPAP